MVQTLSFIWPLSLPENLWHSAQGLCACLQASFDAAMAQKQALEDDATATQRKMDSANALLSALAGEEGRWTQQSKEFDDTIQKLTGMQLKQLYVLLMTMVHLSWLSHVRM